MNYFEILRRLPSFIRRQPAAEIIVKRLVRNSQPVVKDLLDLYTLFKPEVDELYSVIVAGAKTGIPLDKVIPEAVEGTVHKIKKGMLPGALTVEEEKNLSDRLSREG